MPIYLNSLVPDPEDLFLLESEELAGLVLICLNSIPDGHEKENLLVRGRCGGEYTYQSYSLSLVISAQKTEEIRLLILEAWSWLEREGLIASKTGDFYFITRRGKKIISKTDFESFRHSNLLPKNLLHPVIAQKIWATFLRGDYDTSVFQALKEVEVAVRNAGNYSQTDIGVQLMRSAFNINSGKLTDPSLVMGEKQAMSDVFAGVIGLYRNSTGHRHVQITATEAVEIIIFASHLLKIVDSRTP